MKNFSLAILLFTSAVLNCQTVTQAFNEPTVGEVDRNYKLDTSAYTTGLPSSVTGSNVVWDFTKVTGAFPVIFDSVVAPSSATGGSTFPTATYAQKRSGIHTFFKSGSAPSQTEWLGVYSPSLTITFTNSAIIATYPINFGYSSTDPVTGTFKYNTTNGVCNGSLTVTADGVGTLNLPDNVSFPNVLRVRSVEELTMTVGFLPVGTISQSIFSYYVPGRKYPLISAQYQKYQLLAGTPTITAMAYGNFDYFSVVSVDHFSSRPKMEVYPNPFHDNLFFKNESLLDPCQGRILDLYGKQLKQFNSTKELSTGDLFPGVYLLEIKNSTGTSYQKIVRE